MIDERKKNSTMFLGVIGWIKSAMTHSTLGRATDTKINEYPPRCSKAPSTYDKSIFIALVHVHHTNLFFTRVSFQNPLCATKICFARVQSCIGSLAFKMLCRQSILIAEVNSCIRFNF